MTGHSFQLIYNDSGFYMHNSGTDAIRDIRDISFGALTVDGLPTGYVMDGGRWSAGYFAIETNKCDGVEILDVSWTKPGQCGGYNALVNEAGDDSTIFWVARDGMTHFRVLWDGVEVARCEIAAGTCSGFVPSRER